MLWIGSCPQFLCSAVLLRRAAWGLLVIPWCLPAPSSSVSTVEFASSSRSQGGADLLLVAGICAEAPVVVMVSTEVWADTSTRFSCSHSHKNCISIADAISNNNTDLEYLKFWWSNLKGNRFYRHRGLFTPWKQVLAVSTWGKLGAALLMLGTAARLARAAATGICSFIARARAGVLQADQKIETSVCTADWQVLLLQYMR